MNNIINVAVLGSTGYVGNELVKILSNHKNVNINFLGSESINNEYLVNFESNKKYTNLPLVQNNKNFDPSISEYVFLALPHGVSNEYVNKLTSLIFLSSSSNKL